MARIARCHTEHCHAPAVTLCSRCEEPVCGYHLTMNEVCFECALGMEVSAQEMPIGNDPNMIWWKE